MDGSPLTLAQSHARKASKAIKPTVAIEEHELAAGQFASAAQGTENSEAFRTLKLLEQHHAKLSLLLKSQISYASSTKPESSAEVEKPISAPPPASPSPQAHAGSPYRPESQSLAAAHRPQRDVSSSIASNLASARGIPSNKQRRSAQASSPAVAKQQAEGKILSPQRRPKLADAATKAQAEAGRISEKGPVQTPSNSNISSGVTLTSKEEAKSFDTPASKNDDAFNRFYNTFETLFSKLSAPLAFAGLPINPDSENISTAPTAPENPLNSGLAGKQPRPKSKPTTRPTRATAEPDYSRLFSPAALAAVREEPGGSNLGAAESFYVVPTTGGTMQYANILARQHQQHPYKSSQGGHTSQHNRRLSRDSTGEDLDEFVDAQEMPGPPSPHSSRKVPGQKSMEELQLENESLRAVLDEMSRRLWQFEMGAQMGSVALQQSIRASLNRTAGGHSPAASEAGGGDKALDGRVAGLEDEVGRAKKELERMGRENEKLKGVVGRYRERWEKLKEGARTRRGGTGGSGGGGGGATGNAGDVGEQPVETVET